ncbi:WASH complex subunit [Aureococcus anophagefferens]|uniref:WASH complex subunit n=1 Tax=Aureococcus anophagefferens TaxID=44056 RepID=A0ABR1FM33_AURAN
MADADDMCDKSQLPPVPQVKVVTLVNNFITNTVSFLNVFATSAEEKLSGVAQRISGVELTLALLEAKLNSVPGVADVAPIRMKMVAEGVDPDVIADPERRVPAPPPGGGDDEG